MHIFNKQMPKCVGKKNLGSSLKMAHDGHMGQTGYRNVRPGAKLYENPNTP
jgi:hypothetical protein